MGLRGRKKTQGRQWGRKRLEVMETEGAGLRPWVESRKVLSTSILLLSESGTGSQIL